MTLQMRVPGHSEGLEIWLFAQDFLVAYIVWANSEGSGETALMRRLAWAFAVLLCGKYPGSMNMIRQGFSRFIHCCCFPNQTQICLYRIFLTVTLTGFLRHEKSMNLIRLSGLVYWCCFQNLDALIQKKPEAHGLATTMAHLSEQLHCIKAYFSIFDFRVSWQQIKMRHLYTILMLVEDYSTNSSKILVEDYSTNSSKNYQNFCHEIVINANFHFSHYKSMKI